MSVVAVSNVGEITDGPWKEWLCIGNSLFVGDKGDQYLELPYGEKADTIVYHNITLKPRPARGGSWSDYWRNNNLK